MGTVNLKKASTYYFVGNIFNKGVAFLMIPIFTRILSSYDYGIMSTYNSWIGILSMVIGFALHTGIRLAFVDFKDQYDDYMSATAFFTIISSAAMSVMILGVAWILGFKTQLLLIGLCLLQSSATALVQDYSYYLMMKYQYKMRTALMILPNIISIILSMAVIIFVFDNEKYMGRIIPTALVTAAFAIYVLILIFKKSRVLWKKEYLVYGLRISAPLIIHGIALNVLSQSDRTMITMLADASQTGIYSLIYNFSMVATVITTSLEGVWVPWFIIKMEEKNQEKLINKSVKDYINLMTYAMFCLTLVAPEIVKLMADKIYWEGIVIIPPVVLANFVVFMYTLYVNIEHYYKRTIYITINTLIAAGINIILNFIFIPYFGYVAAAYTTLISYIISFVLHASYARKLEKDLYPIRFFYRSITHLIISCIIFYLVIDIWLIRWSIVFFYFFSMLLREKERIFEFFPLVERKLNRYKR